MPQSPDHRSPARPAALLALGVLVLAVVVGNAVGNAAAARAGTAVGVDAVVLDGVPASFGSDSEVAPPSGRVRVAWRTADGATRVATTTVPAGTRAGESRRVWTGPDGSLVPRPADGSAGTVAALLTLVAGAGAAGGVVAAHRAARARARGRDLAREWARVEPLWSGRVPAVPVPGRHDRATRRRAR